MANVADVRPAAILIANGTVVNADGQFAADVLIEHDKIVAVGPNLSLPDGKGRIIDAKNKLVMPGGIDTHTHLQLPFMGTVAADDFHTGTQAAVAGGTTTVMDFVIPSKGESLVHAYNKWRGWADPKVNCDYTLHVAITHWNDEVAREMEVLTTGHGVNSFKCFMAYKGVFMITDGEMFNVFKNCKRLGALPMVHAENGDLVIEGQKEVLASGVKGPEGHELSRPECVEAEATNRACVIALRANSPVYIVHVMSKGAAHAIVRNRQEGAVVYGEPIAAGLGVDGTFACHCDWRKAAAFIMSPPLRSDPTVKFELMKLLRTGDLHCVGTDNCTFNANQKALGKDDFTKIPNGVNGIEDRMSVVWTNGVAKGWLTPPEFVRVVSTAAAQIFNMYPQKGRIQVGSDADVVIWDPNAKRTISAKTHHHAVDYNIFEGMEVTGVAEITISRGWVVWEHGKLHTRNGHGKFIPRKCFGMPYDGIALRDAVSNPAHQMVKREPYTGPVIQL